MKQKTQKCSKRSESNKTNYQSEIIIFKTKIKMDKLNRKLKKAEERIGEATNISEEISQNIDNKEVENMKERLSSLRDRLRNSNLCLFRVPNKSIRKNEEKETLKKVIAKNFLKLAKNFLKLYAYI